MDNKGMKLERENFTISVKYSPEAVEKKLIKFTVTKGDEFVLSADELLSVLVGQVNAETLSAAFVETDRINVVEVMRQIKCVLDKDYKKGDVININYVHPYPVEYALVEEAFKIAQINKDTKVTELTADYLENVKKRITPKMVDFTKKFYRAINSVNLKNKKMENVEEYQGKLGKYKIIGEVIPMSQDGEPQAALDINSVHEVPVAIGDDWIANGLAIRVEEEVEVTTPAEPEKSPEEKQAEANSNHSDSPEYTGTPNP